VQYPLTEHPDIATALVYTSDDEFFTGVRGATRRA